MQVQMLSGIVFRDAKTKAITVYTAGDIVDLSNAEAKQLVDENSAVYVEEPAPVVEKPKRTKVV